MELKPGDFVVWAEHGGVIVEPSGWRTSLTRTPEAWVRVWLGGTKWTQPLAITSISDQHVKKYPHNNRKIKLAYVKLLVSEAAKVPA